MGEGTPVDLGIDGIEQAEPIGAGGSATVYRAVQSRLNRDVAVKVMSASTGPSTAMAFTPSYAPPETMRGELPTTAGDGYSLGAMLLHLLPGRVPFAATDGSGPNRHLRTTRRRHHAGTAGRARRHNRLNGRSDPGIVPARTTNAPTDSTGGHR